VTGEEQIRLRRRNPGGVRQVIWVNDFQVDDPDRELVERTRRGELSAFGELVERHADVVFRVAARVVGPDEAQDISQDAFLRAFHRLSSFRGTALFRSWLLQITHNAALNALARKRPAPVPRPHEDDGDEADAAPAEREPAAMLERSERSQRLEGKLRALRPVYRSLLVLRDLEGLSYEEIAEILEMPLGSVKGRLHRARGELINALRNNAYDWELPQ
jgi:RNA polymerase sigma-70 factor (ECF subfamily)